ncbi:MAG TPA: hypothetical protein ENH91_00380 [Leeuwenhoekiella sp.]|nr:hypothetical protein [Leeuwenhoekiella sp.]
MTDLLKKEFLSIKQAGALINKQELTIRRLIKRVLKENKPDEEGMIKKTPLASGPKGHQHKYKINRIFLLKHYKMDYLLPADLINQVSSQNAKLINQARSHKQDEEKKSPEIKEKQSDKLINQETNQSGGNPTIELQKEVIGILHEQLKAKDKQLQQKHEENHLLIQANREAVATTNILAQKLSLPHPDAKKEPDPEIIKDPTEKPAKEPDKTEHQVVETFSTLPEDSQTGKKNPLQSKNAGKKQPKTNTRSEKAPKKKKNKDKGFFNFFRS